MKKLILLLFLVTPLISFSQINPQDTMLFGTWTYILYPVVDVAEAMKIAEEKYGAKIESDVDSAKFKENFELVMFSIFANTSFTFYGYGNIVIQAYSNPLNDPRNPPRVTIGYWEHIRENIYQVVFDKDKTNVFELVDGYLILVLDSSGVNDDYKKIYKKSITLFKMERYE